MSRTAHSNTLWITSSLSVCLKTPVIQPRASGIHLNDPALSDLIVTLIKALRTLLS